MALALRINPVFLLVVAVCPLMMFFMTGSMSGADHAGHGCEHDPARVDHPAEHHS